MPFDSFKDTRQKPIAAGKARSRSLDRLNIIEISSDDENDNKNTLFAAVK